MDNKDGKKKESIDDILSDLNGLLNKMPSILDGIKMPEVKPVEFTPAVPPAAKRPVPEPMTEVPVVTPDADKTVVLPAFDGLPEGAQEPGPGTASVAGEDLVPQSLGDFMFGGDEPASGPAAGSAPGAAREEAVPELPVIEPARTPKPAEPNPFETTRDFGGIPDIDALMQLSDADLNGLSGGPASAGAVPAPEPAIEAAPPMSEQQPSVDELAQFEEQLKAAVPQGEAMENKPEEEKNAPQPAPAQESPAPEKASGPEIDFGSLTMEPEAKPQPAAEETLQFEPAVQAAAPAPEAETMQLEPKAASGPLPDAPSADSGGVELSIAAAPESAPEGGMSSEQRPAAAAEETLSVGQPQQGMVLEPAGASVPGGGRSGDETLVVPPPSGDEDKTVIFEAGAAPGITSRSQAGDLAGLAERPVPDGIPAERVRSVSFLYSPEDKALCATVLAELDAICLKSAEKPMFVKRASVRECAADMNANYILQTVTEAGAQGLVCVGAIPQEKVYEIENTFTSSGGFFRHYDSAAFTHSAALDLVLDLILR